MNTKNGKKKTPKIEKSTNNGRAHVDRRAATPLVSKRSTLVRKAAPSAAESGCILGFGNLTADSAKGTSL
eukprot:1177574-Prorocentrum_minimum.AAC.4